MCMPVVAVYQLKRVCMMSPEDLPSVCQDCLSMLGIEPVFTYMLWGSVLRVSKPYAAMPYSSAAAFMKTFATFVHMCKYALSRAVNQLFFVWNNNCRNTFNKAYVLWHMIGIYVSNCSRGNETCQKRKQAYMCLCVNILMWDENARKLSPSKSSWMCTMYVNICL